MGERGNNGGGGEEGKLEARGRARKGSVRERRKEHELEKNKEKERTGEIERIVKLQEET